MTAFIKVLSSLIVDILGIELAIGIGIMLFIVIRDLLDERRKK